MMSTAESWQSVEEMEAFRRIEALCDAIWAEVVGWSDLARDTVGEQLVRAADSIGANLVEGDGRYHYREKLNFTYIARGSAKETTYWIRRVRARNLLSSGRATAFLEELDRASRWINMLISQRRKWMTEVREEFGDYAV
jgi:four helix bundle protein